MGPPIRITHEYLKEYVKKANKQIGCSACRTIMVPCRAWKPELQVHRAS